MPLFIRPVATLRDYFLMPPRFLLIYASPFSPFSFRRADGSPRVVAAAAAMPCRRYLPAATLMLRQMPLFSIFDAIAFAAAVAALFLC